MKRNVGDKLSRQLWVNYKEHLDKCLVMNTHDEHEPTKRISLRDKSQRALQLMKMNHQEAFVKFVEELKGFFMVS